MSNDIVFTVVVTTLLILLLIAGVVITMFFANRRHIQQEVKISQMQINYEKELRAVENEVQEQTLSHISRELHDNIGQLLTLMRIQLEQEKIDRPELATILAPVDETLTNTTQQLRLLSHSLNNELLEQNGLKHMIQQETKKLEQVRKIDVYFETDEEEAELTKDSRIVVFRIFQEMLNNILKHAEAKNIFISLRTKNKFSLTVTDDGRGFDLQETMRTGKGAGLKNMAKRAALANLYLHIDSSTGEGSTFTLSQTNI